MRTSSRELPGLDGLRGLAALAVVCLHVWMYTDAHRPGRSDLVDAIVGEFRVAVGLFFVLSAFLLARPWVAAARGERPAPGVGRFALRRLARIGPAYWVALTVSFLLLHGTGHGRASDAGHLPIFAAFMENVFSSTRSKLDPPMWSLGIEVAFYAALPLIGWALIRAARRRPVAGPLLVCAALTAGALVWAVGGVRGGWPPETMWTLPTYLPLFMCGIAAAVLAAGRRPGRRAGAGLLAGGALLVAANGWWHSSGTGFEGHVIGDLPSGLGFAAILAAVALRPPGLLASAPLRALGTASYGIYLWHMPIMFALQLRGAFPHTASAALPRVLLLTLVAATVSWWLIERPVLRLTARAGRRAGRAEGRARPRIARATVAPARGSLQSSAPEGA
ncbi:MAG: acyltransferase family protein [Solirubrobacteraceae bacterium]